MMTRQSPIVQASAASVIKTSWRYGGPHTIPDQTSGRTNSASSPKAPASTATESTAQHDKAASGNPSRARTLNLSFAKRATGPEHRANRSKRHMWEKRSQVTLRIFRQATRTGSCAHPVMTSIRKSRGRNSEPRGRIRACAWPATHSSTGSSALSMI